MKSLDNQLNRLLKAAARAPKPGAGAAMFGLETRVLAHWLDSLQTESGETFVLWFRRAAICAGVLAIASLAWDLTSLTSRSSTEVVADSAMSMGVEP